MNFVSFFHLKCTTSETLKYKVDPYIIDNKEQGYT